MPTYQQPEQIPAFQSALRVYRALVETQAGDWVWMTQITHGATMDEARHSIVNGVLGGDESRLIDLHRWEPTLLREQRDGRIEQRSVR